jgi:hypothetical protein
VFLKISEQKIHFAEFAFYYISIAHGLMKIPVLLVQLLPAPVFTLGHNKLAVLKMIILLVEVEIFGAIDGIAFLNFLRAIIFMQYPVLFKHRFIAPFA